MNLPILHLLLCGRLPSDERRRLVRELVGTERARVNACAPGGRALRCVDIMTDRAGIADVPQWRRVLAGYPELDDLRLRWHEPGGLPDIVQSDLLVVLASSAQAQACLRMALCEGVPVLVPDDMAREDVHDGINGFRFRGDDVHSLALSLLVLKFLHRTVHRGATAARGVRSGGWWWGGEELAV